MDPFERRCLLDGLDDIGLSLIDEPAITAFEAQRPAWMPDLTRVAEAG
jgi:3-isopropylmalate/(R)-2-methylmalate dehydratase small subunit